MNKPAAGKIPLVLPGQRIDPRPSVALAYRQSFSFDDPKPYTGQSYPRFELDVPALRG